MSSGDVFITFRGEADVCVDYHIDESGPGSGCSVEWDFHEKRADMDVTRDEEEAIIQACIKSHDGGRDDYHDDDVPIGFMADRDPAKPLGTPISEISGRPGDKGYAEFCRIARSWGYD